MQNKTLSIFKIVTLAIILTTGLSFAYASWTDATVFPPGEGTIEKASLAKPSASSVFS